MKRRSFLKAICLTVASLAINPVLTIKSISDVGVTNTYKESLQQQIDFLYNAHIANIRKAMNTLIIDPYIVDINDLIIDNSKIEQSNPP